jgi:hypothetical protein
MARRRVMEIGPSVRGGGVSYGRQTVSSIRQDTRGGTQRIRMPKNAVTSKSQLRKKIVKGITQPGYQAPNYAGPVY